MKRLLALLIFCVMVSISVAQDGLNLPTELYILVNDGTVERYGLGAAGVQTVTPQDAFILDFAVAPDDNWIAFRTETGITLHSLVEDMQVSLEGETADVPPVRGRGSTMAWSPGGDVLAYTTIFGIRLSFDPGSEQTVYTNVPVSAVYGLVWSPDGTYLAAETENNVWWIYQRDGTALNLASVVPASNGLTWLDDARLIFAPPEGGLFTMDLLNANAQVQLMDAALEYRLPLRKADGSIVVFSRPAATAEAPGFATYQRLSLDEGVVTVEDSSDIPVDLTDMRWAPGGDLMIAFQGGVLALVLPQTGDGFPLPIVSTVAYDWGPPRPNSATGFSLPFDAHFLAATSTGIVQVWQLPGNGLPPMPITNAETDITEYAVSRDGLAYVSDGDVWYLSTVEDAPDASELASVPDGAHDLAFNPAGDQLLYVDEAGVWSVAISAEEAAEPELLLPSTDGTFSDPQFAPNVNAILIRQETADGVEQMMYDPVSQEMISVGSYDDAMWISGGRILGVLETEQETVIDLVTPSSQETAVAMRVGSGQVETVRETAVGQLSAVLSGDNQPGQTFFSLMEVDVAVGEPDQRAELSYVAEPQISPDGQFVAGFIQPDGALAIYDVNLNQTTTLRQPAGITQFEWRSFR